jgi:hypothetical protein
MGVWSGCLQSDGQSVLLLLLLLLMGRSAQAQAAAATMALDSG